jgi:hypothetical protein
METALEASIFLKVRHPQSEIMVRDLKSGAPTVIGWKNGWFGFSAELNLRRAVSQIQHRATF